jgi:hypothetical protein
MAHNIVYPNLFRISLQFGDISEQGSHIHPSGRTSSIIHYLLLLSIASNGLIIFSRALLIISVYISVVLLLSCPKGRRRKITYLRFIHNTGNKSAFINRNFGLRSVGVCEAYPSFSKAFLKVFDKTFIKFCVHPRFINSYT